MLLTPLPLSQTVTPSRTPPPSSVTYFMDGPYGELKFRIVAKLIYWDTSLLGQPTGDSTPRVSLVRFMLPNTLY